MAPKLPPPTTTSESASESGSEYESESDQEQEPKPIQPSLKSPKPQQHQQQEESDSDDDDDSADSGSDSDESPTDSDNEPVKHMIVPRTTPASTEIKPISSKPMKVDPKRPSTPSAAAPKAAKKKKVSELVEDVEHEVENEKKPVAQNQFQRVFSDKDEVVLLNGLIEFKKKGHNVLNNLQIGEFMDFFKDKLKHVNQSQMINKIQRMKHKYLNKVGKLKPGEDPVISKPHELKCYELSKEIWGKMKEDNGVEVSDSDGKKRKCQVNGNVNGVASPKRKVLKVENSTKVEKKEEEDIGSEAHVYLNASMSLKKYPLPALSPSLEMFVENEGWGAIGKSKAFQSRVEALDKKWKKVLIDEGKAYLKRVEAVAESTKVVLDYLESSD